VCRGGATEEQPLFYPCLCSGSIKYVHQDCLVEWLKHSKKKYCELCKHSFSFSPIYREQMPRSLPLSVIIWTFFSHCIRLVKLVLRYGLVGLAWGLVLPFLAVQPFRWYFGWRALWAARWFVDPLLGALLLGVILLAFVGLMMLREYMEQHSLFAFLDALVVEAKPQVDEGDIWDASKDLLALDDDNEDEAPRNVEPGSWLEQVTPREYRAFLRRREYHREKNERLRVRHHEVQSQRNAEILRMIDAGLSEAESVGSRAGGWETDDEARSDAPTDSFNPYMLNTTNMDQSAPVGTYRMGSDVSEASTMLRNRPVGPTSNVVFRESFRCRVCQRRSCVSREHVIEASQLQRAADPVLQEPPAAPAPVLPVQPAPAQQDNRWGVIDRLLQLDDDPDGPADADAPGLLEVLGLEGSLGTAMKYYMAAMAFVQILVHTLFVFPLVLGTLVVDGTLPIGLLWLRLAWNHLAMGIKSQFVLAADHEAALAAAIPWLKGTVINAVNLLLWGWDAGIALLSEKFPFTEMAQYSSANVGAFLRAVQPLVTFEAGPLTQFAMRLVSGYVSTLMIDGLIFGAVLRWCSRPFPSYLRQLLSVVYLFGSFFKLMSVSGFMFVVIPMYSGVLMDFFTLGLFKATVLQRLEFFHAHPILSALLHFLPGFAFSIGMSYAVIQARTTLRPGLLYFIRNPDDPDDRYAKDVLERPFASQFLGMVPTFWFYTVLVTGWVGATSWLVLRLFPSIAPLRVSLKDPLTSLPFDFFIQAIGKLVLDVINPYVCTQYLPVVFKAILRQLRLSSFFLGGRYLPEESFPKGGRWVFVPDFDRLYKRDRLNAMWRRDPQPMDIAKLPIREGRPSPVQVDFYSIPQPRRSAQFKRASGSNKKEDAKGFTVVFRPNHFALRCAGLAMALWAYYFLAVLMLGVVPLLTGRAVTGLFVETPMRDAYNFVIGFICFGILVRGAVEAIRGVLASDRARLRKVFVEAPWIAFKIALVTSIFFALWPVMLGGIIWLALSPAIQRLSHHYMMGATRLITLSEVWTVGVILVKWMLKSSPPYIKAEYHRAIVKMKLDGFMQIDLVPLMTLFILPMTLKLCLYLVEPALYCLLASAALGWKHDNLLTYQSWAYTISALRPIVIFAAGRLMEARRQFLHSARDEAYLIGNRLHNLEVPQVQAVPAVQQAPPTVAASPAKTSPQAPRFNGSPSVHRSVQGGSAHGSVRSQNTQRY